MRAICLLLVLASPAAYPHDIHCQVLPGLCVRAQYDREEPVANAKVEVYAPGDLKNPILQGRTDDKGEFYFMAHRQGMWLIRITDATGHVAVKEFTVDESLAAQPTANPAPSLVQKIAMAICVVWALIATALFFVHRRKGTQNAHN